MQILLYLPMILIFILELQFYVMYLLLPMLILY